MTKKKLLNQKDLKIAQLEHLLNIMEEREKNLKKETLRLKTDLDFAEDYNKDGAWYQGLLIGIFVGFVFLMFAFHMYAQITEDPYNYDKDIFCQSVGLQYNEGKAHRDTCFEFTEIKELKEYRIQQMTSGEYYLEEIL